MLCFDKRDDPVLESLPGADRSNTQWLEEQTEPVIVFIQLGLAECKSTWHLLSKLAISTTI
jgi:hypothetical protein